MYTVKIFVSILFLSIILLQDCPPNDTIPTYPMQNNWDIPLLNDWDDLDIMTWNIKEFPLSTVTINSVNEIITDVLPDIILFQEINDLNEFADLASTLYAYEFINTMGSMMKDKIIGGSLSILLSMMNGRQIKKPKKT